jgi:hypothetical protein
MGEARPGFSAARKHANNTANKHLYRSVRASAFAMTALYNAAWI